MEVEKCSANKAFDKICVAAKFQIGKSIVAIEN